MEKFINRAVWPILAAPAVYLALVWNNIPPQVALHFDWSGKADRFGSKNELLTTSFILVITNIAVYLILTNIYRIDPKKNAAENKDRLKRLAFGVVVFLSAVLSMIIYSSSKGNISFSSGILLSGMGLLFAFIGNYMHNIKPNYFAGFRLPWTLENEDNWKKTHALAGKLWFAGGLALAFICLFLSAKPAYILFLAVMGVLTIIPVVYSFRLFREQKKSEKIT